MGEVYRAHDSRLGRDVALKVLRRSSAGEEHLARFSREARAAGSLNHPNIVAVFDVGTDGGVPYVVTELLEGETLRARLDQGPLPYRKAVEYGIQIAQALDAAHAKGIWHRDVKPANAFITQDGRLKLLDFGIAKLSEDQAAIRGDEATVEESRTGEIRGTAGYMSPEQVLGHPVDHRADIFALGAVLYEMFTGARAFHRPSTVETMTAVLQEDPVDPLGINAKLSPVAVAIVRRCLEKSREERFQSARDLAFDLQQLRDQTGGTRPTVPPRSSIRRKVLPALVAAALLLQGVALAIVVMRSPPAPSFEQLTFRRGRIGGARFASDEQAVVYSEAPQGNALEVWRLDLADSPISRSLGYPVGSDVLAARTGELALSLGRRFLLGERFVGTLALAPIGGGSPRELAENIEDADWDASGAKLAVARSTGDVGGHSQIEYPLGTPLYKTADSIRFLRISPDGQRIAFLEGALGRGVSGRVLVTDLSGKVTALTDEWSSVRGLAWSASGHEIWFTAGEGRMNRSLRAVNLKGQQRLVLEAPGSLTVWDIARDGRVLLSRDEERRAVVGVPPGETAERDLSWLDNSGTADISNDGKWFLFGDRFGLYLRDTIGSPPIHLGPTNAFGDDISPDGQTVLATIDSGRQLVRVPRGAGSPQVLPSHGIITSYRGARWFPDGQRVLIAGNDSDGDLRSYIQNVNAGPPQPLTPKNTWGVVVSPDGTLVGGHRHGPANFDLAGRWRPINSGQRVRRSHDRPVSWSEDGRSLWLFRRSEVPAPVFKLEIATGRRQLWKKLVPPDAAGVYSVIEFQTTPTGNAYVYSYTRLLSQLYMVRELK